MQDLPPAVTERLLAQLEEVTKLARAAFDADAPVIGIAAIRLAAELVQLLRLFQKMEGPPE